MLKEQDFKDLVIWNLIMVVVDGGCHCNLKSHRLFAH